jgi:hypothetical protein
MRTKDEILSALMGYAADLPPGNKELALVAITETEVQLDIRDVLNHYLGFLVSHTMQIANKD